MSPVGIAGLLGESVITSGLSWMPAAASIAVAPGTHVESDQLANFSQLSWLICVEFCKDAGRQGPLPFVIFYTPPQTLMWNAKMMICRSLEAPLPAMRFWGCRYF